MRVFKILIVLLLVVLAGVGGFVFAQLRSIDVEDLGDGLHVLRGLGGNTAVLKTSAGAVIVDTMTFPMQGGRIREIATELTGTAPVMIINTHYHLDHTHGNPVCGRHAGFIDRAHPIALACVGWGLLDGRGRGTDA
jgi:glyoxylase-like metal-dependent hydrolase (beta-lactamase superfamily II)